MGFRRTFFEFKPVSVATAAAMYVWFQGRLSLATFRDWRARGESRPEPVPPAKLRFRVGGTFDEAGYVTSGQAIAQDIQNLCKATGHDFYSYSEVLDFGCGCGRVIQNFRGGNESCNLHATDIDPDLVNWCKANLDGVDWHVNGHQPPLPFADNAFDLVYAVSVFTHLDEEFQHAWLRELRRIARPGATLILSVHGEHILQGLRKLDASYGEEADERGLMFISGPKGRLKFDEFPDFYQTTFHKKTYIYDEWSAYFDIVEYVERGILNYQDAVILRKRSDES